MADEIQLKQDPDSARLWRISLVGFVLSVSIFANSITIANIDLWGHLKSGLDNLANRTIAQIDPYSYLTVGERWINHEWLAQIIFAIFWKLGGTFGLVSLKILLSLVVVGIFYLNFRRKKVGLLPASLVILLGISVLVVDFSTIYPQVFSLVGFAFVLLILLRAEDGWMNSLWFMPLIFLFGVNFHGGFLVSLGFFGLWTALYLCEKKNCWPQQILPLFISILVTLINPYHITLYRYLFTTLLDPRPEIDVWGPIPLSSLPGLLFLGMLGFSILGLVYSQRPKSRRMMVLFSLVTLLPLISRRHLPFFAIAAVMIAGEHTADLLVRWRPVKVLMARPRLWHTGALIGLSVLLISLASLNINKIQLIESPPYPVQAVQLIKQSGVKGNLAGEYNWGGYVIWHLWPDIKVSIDGRRETVYSREIYEINLGFLLAIDRWDRLLNDYPTDLVLVNDHSPIYNLMRYQADWRLVFEDQGSALYVRRGNHLEIPLIETARIYHPVDDILVFP